MIKDFKVVSAVDRNGFQDSDKIHEDLVMPDSSSRFIGRCDLAADQGGDANRPQKLYSRRHHCRGK